MATTVIEDKKSRVEEMKERCLQRDIGGFGVKWEQWQQQEQEKGRMRRGRKSGSERPGAEAVEEE